MNLACSRVRIGTNNLAGKGCGLQIKPIVRFLTGISGDTTFVDQVLERIANSAP